MEIKNGDTKEVIPPVATPPQKGNEQEVDFDKELENLENGGAPSPAPAPRKKSKEEELRQAQHTVKHASKRIRELGGDPATAMADDGTAPDPEIPAVDTSNFVTKRDLSEQDARKLARSEGELKVIMWYVDNKGMSVEDAHLLANKGRIKKTLSEITRSRESVPSNGGGGPGQEREAEPEIPELSPESKQRVQMSGMKWDPEQKAYVGKKSMLKYDSASKQWVTKLIY